MLGATPFCMHVCLWLPGAGMYLGHSSDGPSAVMQPASRWEADVCKRSALFYRELWGVGG